MLLDWHRQSARKQRSNALRGFGVGTHFATAHIAPAKCNIAMTIARACALAQPHGQGQSLQAAHKNAANKMCLQDLGEEPHGSDADRLRHPPGGWWHAHDAAALSQRSLERAGGEPRHRWTRSHLLSTEHAAGGPYRLASGERRKAWFRSCDGTEGRIRAVGCQPRYSQRALRRSGRVRSLHGG